MTGERHIDQVFVDAIHVGSRHRALMPGKVSALVRSIQEIGRLMTPISVCVGDVTDADGVVCEMPILVAGAHRLAAARELGWETIDALFMGQDEIDRELWEIDENLCRAELSPAETASHMARRKELWVLKSGKTLLTLDAGGRGHSGFSTETATATGQSKRSVNLHIARGEKITPEVLSSVTGTDMDKGTVLDDLAATPRDQQADKLAELRRRKDARSSLSSSGDDIVKRDADEAAAQILLDKLSTDDLTELLEHLFAGTGLRIAKAVKRGQLDGTGRTRADVSVFDNTRAGAF